MLAYRGSSAGRCGVVGVYITKNGWSAGVSLMKFEARFSSTSGS